MTNSTPSQELDMEMYTCRLHAALRDDAELFSRYRDLVNARAELILYANETGRDPEFIGVIVAFAREQSHLIAIGQEEML
jgi:hypothetical protein